MIGYVEDCYAYCGSWDYFFSFSLFLRNEWSHGMSLLDKLKVAHRGTLSLSLFKVDTYHCR